VRELRLSLTVGLHVSGCLPPLPARINSAMSDPAPSDIQLAASRFREDFQAVRDQVGRVVVGQREIVEGVLTCLFVGGHVLLEGVPGVGKTLLIRTLARALNLSFGRVQFTPDLMPADITGTQIVVEREEHSATGARRLREFVFQKGPIFTSILLADEINRATPKTQSALLEAMQERIVTVGGQSHPLPEPFLVMATQNPVEQEGTYPLPEAQLDRFFFKLLVGTPGREDLAAILDRTTAGTHAEVTPILNAEKIMSHQRLVRQVAIAPSVQDYAIRLVLGTHGGGGEEFEPGNSSRASFATPMVKQFVRLGASPRAAQALVLAGKCKALLDGRPAVSIDDLRAAALPALRHRLILNFEAHAEGITADKIVRNLVDTLPVEGA
jgi:MoxR-like ATPase